jgi:predicted aldo/keto reductase-like oxidoreductase
MLYRTMPQNGDELSILGFGCMRLPVKDGKIDETIAIAQFRYALRLSGELVDGHPGFASQCVQCGQCLDKCPQQIPIPDMLAQVAAELEDDELGERIAVARQLFRNKPE